MVRQWDESAISSRITQSTSRLLFSFTRVRSLVSVDLSAKKETSENKILSLNIRFSVSDANFYRFVNKQAVDSATGSWIIVPKWSTLSCCSACWRWSAKPRKVSQFTSSGFETQKQQRLRQPRLSRFQSNQSKFSHGSNSFSQRESKTLELNHCDPWLSPFRLLLNRSDENPKKVSWREINAKRHRLLFRVNISRVHRIREAERWDAQGLWVFLGLRRRWTRQCTRC